METKEWCDINKFTIHFATINTPVVFSTTLVILHLQYTLLLLILR